VCKVSPQQACTSSFFRKASPRQTHPRSKAGTTRIHILRDYKIMQSSSSPRKIAREESAMFSFFSAASFFLCTTTRAHSTHVRYTQSSNRGESQMRGIAVGIQTARIRLRSATLKRPILDPCRSRERYHHLLGFTSSWELAKLLNYSILNSASTISPNLSARLDGNSSSLAARADLFSKLFMTSVFGACSFACGTCG
jgi:hypothetical protein